MNLKGLSGSEGPRVQAELRGDVTSLGSSGGRPLSRGAAGPRLARQVRVSGGPRLDGPRGFRATCETRAA